MTRCLRRAIGGADFGCGTGQRISLLSLAGPGYRRGISRECRVSSGECAASTTGGSGKGGGTTWICMRGWPTGGTGDIGHRATGGCATIQSVARPSTVGAAGRQTIVIACIGSSIGTVVPWAGATGTGDEGKRCNIDRNRVATGAAVAGTGERIITAC